MKVKVFHASENIFRDSLFYQEDGTIYNSIDAVTNFINGKYYFAGELTIFSEDVDYILDMSFQLSQNINSQWMKGQRSSSVGDLFQIGESLYIVSSFGFVKL